MTWLPKDGPSALEDLRRERDEAVRARRTLLLTFIETLTRMADGRLTPDDAKEILASLRDGGA